MYAMETKMKMVKTDAKAQLAKQHHDIESSDLSLWTLPIRVQPLNL